ncbi:hypothetical protein RJ640_018088 [Escallonia rubra]|uniref:Uncharacterized protein n=1 Tax=Escallonia rubra TaxID=112253 RepID=A0AA88QC42_9ASTE|nr:hypothetical protein RJ640_018088 [Escallonia rubra]
MAVERWKIKRGNPCGVCKGIGFCPCKLCKRKSTIEWSPLYDPVVINPCLCPTCDGNRLGTKMSQLFGEMLYLTRGSIGWMTGLGSENAVRPPSAAVGICIDHADEVCQYISSKPFCQTDGVG